MEKQREKKVGGGGGKGGEGAAPGHKAQIASGPASEEDQEEEEEEKELTSPGKCVTTISRPSRCWKTIWNPHSASVIPTEWVIMRSSRFL